MQAGLPGDLADQSGGVEQLDHTDRSDHHRDHEQEQSQRDRAPQDRSERVLVALVEHDRQVEHPTPLGPLIAPLVEPVDATFDPGAPGALVTRMNATHKGGMCGTQVRYYHRPGVWQALNGITRQTTLQIAADRGIPTEVCPLQPYDVYTADEAFFTSTPYCIMPATTFNGLPVGDGKVGPITKRLMCGWNEIAGYDLFDRAIRALESPLREELLAEMG